MLAAFEEATVSIPAERVHVEYFSAQQAPATGGAFIVELARTGRSIAVPQGKTILEMLLAAGIDVPYSCTEGVCGTCETKVLAGTPDHRDVILSKEERLASKSMMICCSGCKGERLVLDL
jgi:vanillate O-demethylase ferredoxin subunit